jgi:hypothetical protein
MWLFSYPDPPPPSGEGRKEGRQVQRAGGGILWSPIVFHVGGGSVDRALSCDLGFKGMFCVAFVY